ncbi:uncharacterized protein ColSpa_06383 [Colletotrichum spaethianum]|uniref:Uncharacterized protein n=1 Tax=Colletotrichum spaethianum TaxID=700344 RepID=A0AA37LCX8_9PEZI|nr:uncharacterized protein ColSpa_06383 [Colletotrichum spaethianum]GKT46202.1 hypothetical protein ColSpa_06383 [Colletotrichum spaethianum]
MSMNKKEGLRLESIWRRLLVQEQSLGDNPGGSLNSKEKIVELPPPKYEEKRVNDFVPLHD